MALNRPIDVAAAEAITSTFIEAVIAPAIDDPARDILARKANMRVVVTDLEPARDYGVDVRSILGAVLVQAPDRVLEARRPWDGSATASSSR